MDGCIGTVQDIHYGDILIKYSSIIDVESDDIPFIAYGKESKRTTYLRDGDVIIADTAEDETVGKCCEIININDAKVESGLHTMPCRPLASFVPMFLGYYMNSQYYHKQLFPLMQGVKVLSISKSNIGKTQLSAPSSHFEQKKIVGMLHLIDRRISKQQQIIEVLKKYKRGLHHRIFAGLRRSDCHRLTLREIASFSGGGTPSKDIIPYWSGDIGWISSSDILEEWVDTISITRRISKEAIENSATKLCPKGSIAIVSRVGVGKVAIMPEELCTSQDFTNITSIEGDTLFMTYQIAYWMKIEAAKTQGTSIKGITADTIKAMEIDLPHLDEQDHIARMLSAFDQHLRHETNKLDTLVKERSSLLQQLFI